MKQENKINIAELLKDCPEGMELDSTLFDDIYFDCIDDVCDIIKCYIQESKHKIGISFDKYGHYSNISKSKCVIFPKGKTTWEGFQRPFKDGDIVFTHANCLKVGLENTWVSIFKGYRNDGVDTYVDYNVDGDEDFYTYLNGDKGFLCMKKDVLRQRLATEEEKAKLFQAIKDNGYTWNEETKTLDKLMTPNKFDITTLKPFESRVLVRDYDYQYWRVSFFGCFDKFMGKFDTVRGVYIQCIPYEGNEHLLGTTNDCDDFYKTWE